MRSERDELAENMKNLSLASRVKWALMDKLRKDQKEIYLQMLYNKT